MAKLNGLFAGISICLEAGAPRYVIVEREKPGGLVTVPVICVKCRKAFKQTKIVGDEAKKTKKMGNQIAPETWHQIKTAYAAGIGLREIARNMSLSENTVLARARRERWSQQIQDAKRSAEANGNAIDSAALSLTPMHSAAITMQQRADRHVERMAGVSERVVDHVETMEGHSRGGKVRSNGPAHVRARRWPATRRIA